MTWSKQDLYIQVGHYATMSSALTANQLTFRHKKTHISGVGDSVRCYFCGGGLRNWEQDDVPMEEHAKWYPECPHVLSVKGHDYVTKVKRREKPRLPNGATTKGLEHIESVAAQVCIAWDFSKEMVMKAIDIYFEQHGNCDFKANDLLLILFEIEEESEIGSDIYTYVKAANTREDSQRHTTYVRGLYTAVQKQDWIVRDKNKRSSGTSAWAASLIKKLMTVLDDTLKTATDIMSLLVKRCPQLFPDLTREPTERDLVTFAEAIGGNFRFLGLDLGLSDAKLDQISLDNPTTVMKTYSMLREWSGKNPLKATVSSLIQTMKSCRSVKIDWNQIGKVCMGS
ncbi:uncharacterized protein LOC123550972 isoform X2 [Mercenaria mercenaria]|uniref:uncharacterized protein LOC123550972 isoform X2 n=1 Tax=Mercenaria mercenaria TaxID=6596 RepID=UPI00234F5A86|nr:uncharacterized protein LOC123550972 isoform X2 [Mercenaria mercenaria]